MDENRVKEIIDKEGNSLGCAIVFLIIVLTVAFVVTAEKIRALEQRVTAIEQGRK